MLLILLLFFSLIDYFCFARLLYNGPYITYTPLHQQYFYARGFEFGPLRSLMRLVLNARFGEPRLCTLRLRVWYMDWNELV